MRSLATILFISFIAIGIFGFLAMGHTGCIMTIATQNSCMQGQPFADVVSHLQLYRSFSAAVMVGIFMVGLWSAMFRYFMGVDTIAHADQTHFAGMRSFEQSTVAYKVRRRFLAWLSTRERADYDARAIAGA